MTGLGVDRIAAVVAVVVDASLRTAVVVGLAALTVGFWRRPSTRMRSLVWTSVLYAALAMPFLERTLPVLPLAVPATSALTTFAPAGGSSMALRDQAAAWLGHAPIFEAASTTETTPVRPQVTWLDGMIVFYAAGFAWLFGRMVLGWAIARRLCLRGTPINDPAVLQIVAAHASRLGLASPPRLIEHSRLFVPVTMGFRRPVIGLPADWREWAAQTLDAVVVHEVSHVARRDTLTLWLSQAYRACSWFNPVSWWLHGRLSDLAEEASDEAALESGISRTAYAETLLAFFKRVPGTAGRAAWTVAMARPDGAGAERRIDRVLAWDRPRSQSGTRRVHLTVVVTAAVLVAAAASVQLTARVLPSAVRMTSLLVNPVSAPSRGSSRVALPMPIPAVSPAPARARAVDDTPASAPSGATSVPAVATVEPPASQAPTPIVVGFGAGSYRPGTGVTLPTPIHKVDPHYTKAAMAQRLQGNVELQAVVLADGTVGDVVVSKSLDKIHGLDDQAVAAARQWVFSPGLVGGQPVPVLIILSMQFRVGDNKESPGATPVAYVPEPLADAFGNGAYWSGDIGAVAPEVLRAVEPKYTAQALRDLLQGDVEVEVIVMPDGSVNNVRVLRSIDPVDGLDANAVTAAWQTIFKPGTLNGQAVPMVTTLDLTFRIH
jgi:TonB family protein